jgi:hypothetical protein
MFRTNKCVTEKVYIRRLLKFILPTKKPSFITYFVTNLIHIQFTQLFYLLLIDLT